MTVDNKMKITILGAGNMGGAIARGLARGGSVAAGEITCTAGSSATLERLRAFDGGFRLSLDNAEAVRGADVVVVAVKPHMVERLLSEIAPSLSEGQLLVSIVAGLDFARLEELLAQRGVTAPLPLFRVMPNTAIEVKSSMTFVAAHRASREQTDTVLRLFGELGEAMLIDESQMTPCMILASCGIAFALRYIRANVEGGVELGLPAAAAQAMVAQTLIGAARLLQTNGSHPEAEIDKVTTPGGITIRGINELEHAGFTSAVVRALKACK